MPFRPLCLHSICFPLSPRLGKATGKTMRTPLRHGGGPFGARRGADRPGACRRSCWAPGTPRTATARSASPNAAARCAAPGLAEGAKRREPTAENRQENADAGKQNRPLLGVQIVLGMKPSGTPNKWDGKVYNAKDGKTYTGSFTMTGANTAELKGCVQGVLQVADLDAGEVADAQPLLIARADRTGRRAPSGRAYRPPMPPRCGWRTRA